MKRISGLLSLFTLTLAFSMTANRAAADSVHLTFDGAFGDAVTVSGENTIAGPYKFTIGAFNNSQIPNGDYYGFCIQFNQNISNNQQGDFTVETLAADLGQTKADQILRLLNDYSTTQIGGGVYSPKSGALGDPTNPAQYSFGSDALTIAIWDVLQATGNDGSGHLSIGGTNQISATNWGDSGRGTDAVKQANDWLADLQYNVDPTTNLYDPTKVVAFYNESIQDQSLVLGFSPFVQTPEPTSKVGLAGMCMLGLIIGGRFAYGRRRAA
jgi:hypothetical protein